MRRLCSVWVPKLLSDDHRKKRVESAKYILNELSNLGECAPSRYCLEDETWVNFSPMLPKQENKTWVEKSAKRHAIPRPTLTKKKTLLMICLTADKFSVKALPYGDTITSDVYVEFLKATGEKWRKLRSHPAKLSELSFQLDNARPHSAKTTKDFLGRREMNVIAQSPYSPDFNILDRWVNSHLKTRFKHTTFTNAKEVEVAALQALRDIPFDVFLHHLEKLKII